MPQKIDMQVVLGGGGGGMETCRKTQYTSIQEEPVQDGSVQTSKHQKCHQVSQLDNVKLKKRAC